MAEAKFTIPAGSHMVPVAELMRRGLQIATAIDVGCGDGDFLLFLKAAGIIGEATCFNVEANPLYEESLRAIEAATGAGYHIGPLAAKAGPVTLTRGAHPYWNSLRARKDHYWKGTGIAPQGSRKATARTLDSLVRERKLAGPFLLKLDVQAGEFAVLKGARETLKNTALLVVEMHRQDFRAVDRHLEKAGFELFDVAEIGRNAAGNLAWLYGIYLEQSRIARFAAPLWAPEEAAQIVARQEQRRATMLARNASLLDYLRARAAQAGADSSRPA
jgi:FkbM family methyltransferase